MEAKLLKKKKKKTAQERGGKNSPQIENTFMARYRRDSSFKKN